MPIINVKMFMGRSVETKQKFADAITKEAVEILGVKKETVTIIFDEYERDNWAIGGTINSLKRNDVNVSEGKQDLQNKETSHYN